MYTATYFHLPKCLICDSSGSFCFGSDITGLGQKCHLSIRFETQSFSIPHLLSSLNPASGATHTRVCGLSALHGIACHPPRRQSKPAKDFIRTFLMDYQSHLLLLGEKLRSPKCQQPTFLRCWFLFMNTRRVEWSVSFMFICWNSTLWWAATL